MQYRKNMWSWRNLEVFFIVRAYFTLNVRQFFTLITEVRATDKCNTYRLWDLCIFSKNQTVWDKKKLTTCMVLIVPAHFFRRFFLFFTVLIVHRFLCTDSWCIGICYVE